MIHFPRYYHLNFPLQYDFLVSNLNFVEDFKVSIFFFNQQSYGFIGEKKTIWQEDRMENYNEDVLFSQFKYLGMCAFVPNVVGSFLIQLRDFRYKKSYVV